MADNDDKIKISELDPALTLDNTSETVVNKQVSGSWATFKMTIATLAAHILEVFSSSSLRTTNKTVVGAINELQQGGGGGGSSTLAGLNDVNLTTPSNGQVLKYDSQTGKWKNANETGGTPWTDVTGTLTAGNTSVTLQDAAITANSTIQVFTPDGTEWTSISVLTGSVTIEFEAQSSDMAVKVRIS